VSVTYPKGFIAGGVSAGLKRSGSLDLGLLVGDPGTTAAGLFTTNVVCAAPVVLSRARLANGAARAVIVNSGQANAATGIRGERDALAAVAAAADLAGLGSEELLACSTGVIGEPLHLADMIAGFPGLVDAVSTEGGEAFARAIMTTDTVDKCATADAGPLRVGGCAKGVGMIAPHLATMLAFVTTDAAVDVRHLSTLARERLQPVFNALTVDACPSTNDTVLLFASGAAGEPPVEPGSAAWPGLAEAIGAVASSLADQLIHDAEGVTHVLLVDVEGAADDRDARVVARAVADSPLVKTAIFGQDPNPGRVLQAVGSSGAAVDPATLDVWIGDVQLAAGSVIPPAYFEDGGPKAAAKAAMASPEVTVRVRLGDGPGMARMLGCDLSYEYVRINGEYTT
jgi:glutamate N-acetyltransferase/amino-acid N-acetyltransferase